MFGTSAADKCAAMADYSMHVCALHLSLTKLMPLRRNFMEKIIRLFVLVDFSFHIGITSQSIRAAYP